MDNCDVQLIGGPCGQHGPYTFYKAFRYTKNGYKRIVTLSEFFFVKMWRDSDLLCIGELQLLWIDKNSEQVLASLRLYFLPENTPDGRMDHGEDEVLAISEKVVIKVEDLITWITVEAEWTWGRLAKCHAEMKELDPDDDNTAAIVPPRTPTGNSFSLSETQLDFTDVENERKNLGENEDNKGPHVIILSFPKYCRYRAMMKRLEGVEDIYLKYKIVNALGGFYVRHPNTRVLFCRETFDYPELEGHELLCNHLAPKLKGRPRGKRKKRSVSPGSESNESESSLSNCYNIRVRLQNDTRYESGIPPRRSTRCHENNENKEFVKKLGAFMKSKQIPIGRIPSLGYKELNLHEFYIKVQKLGGYDAVSTNRLWKTIFEDISGNLNSTSAATIVRRHYERFLLPYERHVRGEEYKPLHVSDRRRLKSKRGSTSLSDETESSSGDTTPTPSCSRKISTDNKDNPKPEGKTVSLRSIRVKPERQKDKQICIEKDATETSVNNKFQPINVKQEDAKIPEKNMGTIKSETETIKTEVITDGVSNDDATIKREPKAEKYFSDLDNDLPLKMLSNVKVEVEIKSIKTEISSVKSEDNSPIKQEYLGTKIENTFAETNMVKVEPTFVKSEMVEKCVEPVTTAATPIAQKVSPENILSPKEGKENIPLIKTGDVASKNSPEVVEVPYKSQVAETMDVESSSFKGSFIHEVKKRKLDILKEGGLEVTPVRTESTPKDTRPSVIQQISPPILLIPKTSSNDMMPPPSSTTTATKKTHINVPPCTQFPFLNGSTPPKVMQSKSIYSYSEKTVYGNPKDILSPTFKPAVHTPKFISTLPRQSGGDPVDLSVNSPQKPVIEIMRVPQASSSPYNRDSVTKNLYKSASSSLMDARRLGPNLEITLVNPKRKRSPNRKSFNLPTAHSVHNAGSHYVQQKKQPSVDYHPAPSNKSAVAENGRFDNKPAFPHQKPNVDISIPHPFKSPNMKPDPPSRQMKLASPSQSQSKQHYPTTPLAFPTYLSQIYEQTNKNLPPTPYLPLLDPAMYYTAAMQSIYNSRAAMNSAAAAAPVLPIPTPEQLKFYSELMAHGRLNFPFPLPPDGGTTSSPLLNNMKKP